MTHQYFTLLFNLYDPGCCPSWDPCGEEGVPCSLCNCPSEEQLEGIEVGGAGEEGGRNGSSVGSWEIGTGENITIDESRDETNTTEQGLSVAGEGIIARMNLDFLFGERDEVTEGGVEGDEEDDHDQMEEEGIDDGSTCCPAPLNPCEVMTFSIV